MPRARASMAMLLALVGLIAVGLAALRVSSRLWANATFSLALTALVASIALLIHRRGPARSFWVGFALFGWTYFAAAFAPAPFNIWRDLLVTVPALAMLEEWLRDTPGPTGAGGPSLPAPRNPMAGTGRDPASNASGKPPLPAYRSPRPVAFVELSPWTHWTATDRSNPFPSDTFHRIGHSLFCLGIAIGGGAFCLLCRDPRDAPGPMS